MLSYVVHTASSLINPWSRSPTPACSSEIVLSRKPGHYSLDSELSDDQAGSLIERILSCSDLYTILGVGRSVGPEELRRAYMSLCRQCHPDKFPNEPRATAAFQRLSYAYSILSDSESRKLYDNGKLNDAAGSRPQDSHNADDTLNQVLQAVWADFLDGDFEIIRMFIRKSFYVSLYMRLSYHYCVIGSLNEANPALGLGEDKAEALLHALVNLRDVILSGQQHLRLIKFELMRLYEIQHALRQLSYFDIPGRLKLTMQLARLTIALPVNLDKAIMAAQRDAQDQPEGEVRLHRGRYLPSSIHSVINLACSVLETGERVLPSRV
ncbi:hypothetical protein FRC08_017080 [Ceratobasidium sp. 394]|nr:hypothetical protein FRC08_017080 [Ceratobasidium sp. 394]